MAGKEGCLQKTSRCLRNSSFICRILGVVYGIAEFICRIPHVVCRIPKTTIGKRRKTTSGTPCPNRSFTKTASLSKKCRYHVKPPKQLNISNKKQHVQLYAFYWHVLYFLLHRETAFPQLIKTDFSCVSFAAERNQKGRRLHWEGINENRRSCKNERGINKNHRLLHGIRIASQ